MRASKRWGRRGFGVALLSLALSPLLSRAARAEDLRPAWEELSKRVNEAWGTKDELDETKGPRAALALGREFLIAHPSLSKEDPYLWARIYERLAWLQRDGLKSRQGAQKLLDGGIGVISTSFERHILLGLKAQFMFWDGNAKEAEALLAQEWPKAEAEDLRRVSYLAFPYAELLAGTGRGAQASALLREVQERHPSIVANEPFEWMPKLLIPTLLKAGEAEAALSWAKLFWMTCPFTESEINDSTQRLTQAWTASALTPAKGAAFLKAQEDAKAPNPLREVSLPTFKPEVLEAEMARKGAWIDHERITLRILSADWHQAMLDARAFMIAHPDDKRGPQEVCRVFKAADLNIVRANAFLGYLKTGEGENPIAAFLKEHPKKDENQKPPAE